DPPPRAGHDLDRLVVVEQQPARHHGLVSAEQVIGGHSATLSLVRRRTARCPRSDRRHHSRHLHAVIVAKITQVTLCRSPRSAVDNPSPHASGIGRPWRSRGLSRVVGMSGAGNAGPSYPVTTPNRSASAGPPAIEAPPIHASRAATISSC